MPMRIPIFFSFDDNYVIPAAVAFWSLLDRKREDVDLDLHVVHRNISAERQDLLRAVVSRWPESTLSFVAAGDFLLEEWLKGNWEGHQTRNQFTADTLLRCFAARFFPQYDKIVYSDVDVVFADDISDIWSVDLSNAYVAGVKNAFMKQSPLELSHLSDRNREMLKDCYLAGGIWVMNLRRIRENDLEQRMMEIIRDDTIVKRSNDQDVMNIACEGQVAFLPLNYICYPSLSRRMSDGAFPSHYTPAELWDSVLHPKIIHYAEDKPWNGYVPLGGVWWTIFRYLRLEWPDHADNERKVRSETAYAAYVVRLRLERAVLAAAVSILLVALAACVLGGC